jgi:hypothetical protein
VKGESMKKRAIFTWLTAGALAILACGGRDESPASGSCNYEGTTYPDGASFPSSDGCNSCSCDAGLTACTARACEPSCSEIINQYTAAVEASKSCDPSSATNPCTKPFVEGLACGCGTLANPDHAQELEQAALLQAEYSAKSCQQGILCGPCRAPLTAHCSSQGRCEDDYDEPSCKVNGVVYPSGASDIQDPFSCNKCSCAAGELGCTEIGCAKPCPEGTQPGKTCAECGPTDACLVVEHACLKTCSGICADGLTCFDGVCRSVCG